MTLMFSLAIKQEVNRNGNTSVLQTGMRLRIKIMKYSQILKDDNGIK